MIPTGTYFLPAVKKEVIVLSNGKNVYPEEIEANYLASPYIKEICVMGLEARPGDPSSEKLHAVIVPNFEVLRQRKIVNAKEVIRFDIEGISAKLASTKRIGGYEIWQDDLPRTTTRKIKRFEVEKRVRANLAKGTRNAPVSAPALGVEDQQWLEQAEVQQATDIIRAASRTKPSAILPNDNLELDLGLDSMQRVELLASLEKAIGPQCRRIETRRGVHRSATWSSLVRQEFNYGCDERRTLLCRLEKIWAEAPSDPPTLLALA